MTSPETAPIETGTAPQTPRTGRAKRRAIVASGTIAGLLLAGSVGAWANAAAQKDVTLTVDGDVIEATTYRDNVEGLLTEHGVELGEHDELSHPAGTDLADGLAIEVVRAQEVAVLLDGEQESVWTTAEHAGEALAEYLAQGREAAMLVSRSTDRAEIDLPLSSPAVFVVGGEERTVELIPGSTLASGLEQADIELGDLDEVTVTSDQDGRSVVTVVAVSVQEVTETETVAFTSTEVTSDDYLQGTSRVTTEGVDGEITRVYEVTTRDGEEVDRELVSEETTQEMVQEVVTVGTREPEPEPVATSSGSSSSSSGSSSSTGSSSSGSSSADQGSAPTSGVWAQLAQCESGGNPSIVSSNGLYHGLYQFSVSTWQSVGGSGLPSQASAAEQLERAKILQARSGWGQWPACASKLGLL
ncbi:resuscitation-promoting factor [Serinibacter salmoneus]|uniref:Uncharacterized protein YabE (DUF348 family) n=1 Tax=Serinibacter salmoneus TaxID=556530 RepID=A0A2A9D1E4_9MICO|nr:resuscitation-promoting factor [Serinibacter salmoneus]PFG20484.1 uncharacterized protein YabE (DUF348 family) [Serinibacter salmoneus]